MSDLFQEFENLNTKDIMKGLENAQTHQERKFYAGLFNLKSEFAFEGVNDEE
ncbi:MAG: hypothetical protein R3Y63_13935 [Eubacteriales bacterium]